MPGHAADAPRQELPELIIEGVEGGLADNVRAFLRLAAEPCDAPRWRLRRLYQLADGDIENALRPFGYYAPQVTRHFKAGETCWSARFVIDPGTQLRWTGVDVRVTGEAEHDPAFAELLAQRQPVAGDPVSHADYETLKSELLLLAARHGYREGKFTAHQLRVEPQAGRAEVVLHFDSGPRYRFGAVSFSQDAFAPEFIARFSQISPGDEYDTTEVARLQRDLFDSGLFDGVEVRPEHGPNAAREVPVRVRLVPRKQHAWLAGAGVTTDEGPRLRLGYENRRIGRYGHSGEADLRLSTVRSNLDFAYNIPLRRPQTDRLSLQAGYQEEHIEDTDSELYKASVRHIRRRTGGLVHTVFLEAIDEKFEVGTDRGKSTLLMPGVSWDWRRSDSLVNPQRGWHAELEFKGSHTALLSDVDFLRSYLHMKRIHPLPGGRLLARAELGYSLVSDFSELPSSQRFFAGGDNSVRGYGYRELGPVDVDGNVLGGRHLLTASIEYDRPVAERWSVAVFADSGDAFDDTKLDLHHAVGIGLRWHSPLGPVRLDFAHPLDAGADPFRIHFSFGPDL